MRRYIVPLLFGLIGAAILVNLGLWQMRRLEWKESLLAQIDARLQAAPVAVPATPDPERDAFLGVTATGTILPRELLVLTSVKGVGPGFRVIAVLETDAGRRLLLDRGFVPEQLKTAPRPAVRATVIGNLHWPDETDSFTPEPDPAAGMWFARDVPAMAQALGTEPVLIVLRSSDEEEPAAMPLPLGREGIPNNHLQYAITWFLLALAWLGMTGYWLWRIRRTETA